ncbi:MAG: ASCH domain-containing protein [Proteobacteria bacterium]|nr:ASCH domain-containing protein [Pseudomonadota bacterium]
MTEIEQFWESFRKETGTEASSYVAVSFGNSPEMADELLELVIIGQKRATASLLREYEPVDQPVPQVGDHVIVADGAGTPRAIWQTTEITIKPLNQVDVAFAWDEGEGDRSREGWLSLHRAYYSDQARREGFEFEDDIETVFERFRIIWPLDIADPA